MLWIFVAEISVVDLLFRGRLTIFYTRLQLPWPFHFSYRSSYCLPAFNRLKCSLLEGRLLARFLSSPRFHRHGAIDGRIEILWGLQKTGLRISCSSRYKVSKWSARLLLKHRRFTASHASSHAPPRTMPRMHYLTSHVHPHPLKHGMPCSTNQQRRICRPEPVARVL